MARPSATSNYAVAGKAVARDSERIFDIARSTSPDYGQMVKDGMKIKSREKHASIQNVADLRK